MSPPLSSEIRALLARCMSQIPELRRVPHVRAPLCDLTTLPMLRQVNAISGLTPPIAVAAHRLALAMVFKDSGDAFCRGFEILPYGAPC